MASDINKAVVSSLKCVIAGTNVTGKHDVELRISVHVEEERSPSFIDLVEQGNIQFKNFGLQVVKRAISNGCKSCSKDVICEDRQLELVVDVSDTSVVCHECSANNQSKISSKKTVSRSGRKPKQSKETDLNRSSLSVSTSSSFSSPVVVLERLDSKDIKPVKPDFTSLSPNKRSTPQTETKKLYRSPHPQLGTPETNKSISNNVRRSSRTTKSRFRRSFVNTSDNSDVNKHLVSPSNKQLKAFETNSSPAEEKSRDASKSKSRRKSTPKASKGKRQEDLSTPLKRKKVAFDELTLQLSESDNEDYITYEDDQNDPDFAVDDTAADETSDPETIFEELETRIIQTPLIKEEKEDPTDVMTVIADVSDDTLQIKSETALTATSSECNVISQGVHIIKVTVPNVHREEFPCPICPKSYILNRYLLRHLQKAGKVPVLCDICGVKFHYQKDVDQHKLAHSGINQYMCAICCRSFPNLSSVNKHVKNHLPPHERPFICPTCGKGFTEQHSLQEHNYIHAADKPYQCPKCESKFAARYLLNAHMKYHSEKTYRCYTCDRVYKVHASLKEHLLVYRDHYSEDKPEPIPKIPYIKEEETPKQRRKKRKSFVEQKLEIMKKFEDSLRESNATPVSDMSTVASDDEDKSVDKSVKDGKIPSASETFQKHCFDLIGNVAFDQYDQGGNKNTENENVGIEKAVSKLETNLHGKPYEKNKAAALKYKCKICFRGYSSKAPLNHHYRKCGKVCYPCGKCEGKFHSKEGRSQHNLLHTGKHPYQCKVCFKSFICFSKVKRHAVTHLPIYRRPFICEECGKGYAFQNELEKHKWIHNKTGPNKCSFCPRYFRTKSALERHENVHKGKLYSCDVCDKKYKYPSCLKEHLKNFNHVSQQFKKQQKPLESTNSESLREKNKEEKHTVMCDVCGITVPNNTALGAHMRIHRKGDKEQGMGADADALKKFAYEKHIERIVSRKIKLKSYDQRRVGLFKCDECDQEFKLKSSLRRHKSIKHGHCKHECHVCHKKFFVPSELERHLLSHFGERKYQCEFCPKAFYHEFGFKRHLKIHVAKEELAHGCDVCGKRFIEACYLREHMRKHTGERPFVCDVCGKGCISKNILKGHMLSHGPRNHKCTECGKCYTHLSNLNAHMRTHDVSRSDYLCDDCGKSFKSKSGLNRHQIKHTGIKNYKCGEPGCSKSFYFKQELTNHQRSHEDVRPFQCELCGKSFKYRTSFSNHLNTHAEKPPLHCGICNKAFFVASRMKRHMEYHLGERNVECDQCDKKFITKADLTYHKKQHLNSFKCEDCQKVFKLETRLKFHRKVHEGPDRVQCPRCDIFYKDMIYLQTTHMRFCDPKKVCMYCGRKFSNVRRLQSHIGVHTGKRPHQCDVCGTAYVSNEQLQNHKERHKNKRYPCRKCDKAYDRIGDLKKHLEFHMRKDREKKKIEAYKYRLMIEQDQSGKNAGLSPQGTAASTCIQNPLLGIQSPGHQEQTDQDILAQATAGINVIEDGSNIHLIEGGTVVQYVQEEDIENQPYAQVVELDASSLIHDQNLPANTEQVILTTIDTSQLTGHSGNEILMVAMIPETQ